MLHDSSTDVLAALGPRLHRWGQQRRHSRFRRGFTVDATTTFIARIHRNIAVAMPTTAVLSR